MKKLTGILVAAVAASAMAQAAHADLLVDRGLPTANLNNAAGANRSNVAWADSEDSQAPSPYSLPGDNFTLAGGTSYHVSDIRIWTISPTSGLELFGGAEGGAMSRIDNGYTVTAVQYAGALDYQRASGASTPLYQIDFSVDQTIAGGLPFDFFLYGPQTGTGPYVNSYLHASNAPLSGSPQDGADGKLLWLDEPGGTTVETWQSTDGGAWDKVSDANVQVFGTPTPLPSSATMGLGVLGLAGAAAFLRRKPKAV